MVSERPGRRAVSDEVGGRVVRRSPRLRSLARVPRANDDEPSETGLPPDLRGVVGQLDHRLADVTATERFHATEPSAVDVVVATLLDG